MKFMKVRVQQGNAKSSEMIEIVINTDYIETITPVNSRLCILRMHSEMKPFNVKMSSTDMFDYLNRAMYEH